MTIVQFDGFELGTSLDAANISGTIDFNQTAIKRSGARALRVNPTTTNIGYYRIAGYAATGLVGTLFGAAANRVRFSFYWVTKPASGNEVICYLDGPDMDIRLNSAGQLMLFQTDVQIGSTGATALSASTWYDIEFALTSGSTQVLTLNDVSEITAGAAGGTDLNSVYFGKAANKNGNSVDFYYDDACFADAAIGAGKVLLSVPIGAGAAAGWTNGPGADNYTDVDDVPHDTDTTYLGASATQDNLDHTLDMQTFSTIGGAGTIGAIKVQTVARTDSITGTSAVALRRLINSLAYEATPLELTVTYALLSSVEADSIPGGGGAAWTETLFNTVEVGMAANTLAQAQRFTAAYLQVWCTGVGAASGTGAGTFPAFTGSAAGTHSPAAGTGAGTFPKFTGAAVGTQSISGTASGTFPVFTGAADGTHGTPPISGPAAGVFPVFVGAATGEKSYPGVGTGTFPKFVGAAAGTQSISGTAAGTFPVFTGAAVGKFSPAAATAAGVFPVFVGAAVGVKSYPATGNGTFPAFTGSAAGTVSPAAGTGAGVYPAFTGAASGTASPAAGAAAGIFPVFTGAASGNQGGGFVGQGAGVFPSFTGVAVATVTRSGTGVGTFPKLVGAASGTKSYTAAAAGTFPKLVGAAAGTTSYPSTAAGVFPVFIGAATGVVLEPISGVGAGVFPRFVGAATGERGGYVPVTPDEVATLRGKAFTGAVMLYGERQESVV